jgi:hypothetical protein
VTVTSAGLRKLNERGVTHFYLFNYRNELVTLKRILRGENQSGSGVNYYKILLQYFLSNNKEIINKFLSIVATSAVRKLLCHVTDSNER